MPAMRHRYVLVASLDLHSTCSARFGKRVMGSTWVFGQSIQVDRHQRAGSTESKEDARRSRWTLQCHRGEPNSYNCRCGALGRVRYTGLTSEDAKFAMFVFSVDHLGKVSSFPPPSSAASQPGGVQLRCSRNDARLASSTEPRCTAERGSLNLRT